MEKDLLGMNLQYFAEPDDGADKTPPADDDNKAGNDAPTVTVAEMKRRLAKEQEAYQKQIDELKGTFPTADRGCRGKGAKRSAIDRQRIAGIQDQGKRA